MKFMRDHIRPIAVLVLALLCISAVAPFVPQEATQAQVAAGTSGNTYISPRRAAEANFGTGGAGGAPANIPYLVQASSALLSAERVTTNTTTIGWDYGTAGQAKADVIAGSISNTHISASAAIAFSKLEADPHNADIITSGTLNAARLATSGVTAATYGSATASAQVVIDNKGRVTSASNVTITPAFSSLTGKPTTLSGYGITDGASSGAIGSSGLTIGTGKLAGRYSSGTGALQEITIGSGLSLNTSTGELTASGGAGSGNVTHTGALTANKVVIGNGTDDITVLSNLTWNNTSSTFEIQGGLYVSGNMTMGNLAVTGTMDLSGGTVTGSSGAGKIYIGNASGGYTANTITGTTDQVNITNGANSITISLPQSINTTSSPTFAGLTVTNYAHSAALASDDTYQGTTITGLNAGASIAQWEAVYVGGSSTWLLADADGSGTYPARGLAVAAYSSTNPATIVTRGTVRNDAWNWTPGGTIYLSTTAGGLTQTAPSTSGNKVQQVGFALTADIAFFDFASGETLTVQ